jgi:hypothetical protein
MLKSISLLIVFLSCHAIGNSQVQVYTSHWNRPEVVRDIMYVDNPHLADICVNVVDRRWKLRRVPNSWFYEKTPARADVVYRVVTTSNGNRNALRVYINKTPRENTSYLWRRRFERLFNHFL